MEHQIRHGILRPGPLRGHRPAHDLHPEADRHRHRCSYKTTLGPRHGDTLDTQGALAQVRLLLGDAAGAVALLEVAAPALEAAGHYGAAQVRRMLERARAALRVAQPEPEPA
eukprot:COSAG04_NODE_2135_length_4726_cov_5.854333_2_plen_112_part_00